MMTVKATREGRLGHLTATGYRVETVTPFVALPSRAALWAWVRVTNPLTGKTVRARVLDVGPWFTDDHAYVFGGARPQAEGRLSPTGQLTNGAGIDLSEAVWAALGMTDNTSVQWEFL